MDSLWKIHSLCVVLSLTFCSMYSLAEPGGEIVQRQKSSLYDQPIAFSEDISNISDIHLDGVSFEMAVRLGLPLGSLIRGKSASEKLNLIYSENKPIENGESSNQNLE